MNDPDLKKIFVSSIDKDGSEKDQLVCIGKQLVKLLYISQINCSTHRLSGRTINILMPHNSCVKPNCELSKEINRLKDNIRNIIVHATKHNINIEISKD